jgi:hypothetical protein
MTSPVVGSTIRGLLPRVVDEHLVAGDVHLPHHQPATTEPLAVPIAERRVPKPVRVLLEVLVMQQLQRHAGAVSLAMDPRAVWLRPRRRGHDARVQTRFELGVVERLDGLPRELRLRRALSARLTAPMLTPTDAQIARCGRRAATSGEGSPWCCASTVSPWACAPCTGARLPPRLRALRSAARGPNSAVFTMPIRAFTIPIRAFTMRRSWRSRWSDPRVHDRAKSANDAHFCAGPARWASGIADAHGWRFGARALG